MANREDNLNPFNKLPIEEANRIRSMGGKASAEAKKRKKMFKEQAELLLSMLNKNPKIKDAMSKLGIPENEQTNQMAILIGQWQEAVKGNTRASEFLRDTVGEKPKDIIEHQGEINNPYSNLSEEELRNLAK